LTLGSQTSTNQSMTVAQLPTHQTVDNPVTQVP